MSEGSDIPPSICEAYKILKNKIGDEGLNRERAINILSDDDFKEADINYIIDRLITEGYLYEVDNTLYITPE